MVKNIVRDEFFLSKKSLEATKDDIYIAKDLKDTLMANENRCVGMAANMIGYQKRVIIVSLGFMNLVMFNPRIIAKSGKYECEEGCLSLDGTRPCTRYKKIKLEYFDESWNKRIGEYSDYIAEIIQHECDHLEGVII